MLDGLASVVAEAEVHRLFGSRIHCVEHRVDGAGGHRPVGWIAGDVSFVDLEALAGQAADLIGEHCRQGHQQRFEVTVVSIEQRSGQHVGAGQGELERPAGDRASACAVGKQIETALRQGAIDDRRRFGAKAHALLSSEFLAFAAAEFRAGAAHRPHEVFNHPVGIGVIGVEAVEFSIGGQVDARLALRVENHAGGVDDSLLGGHGLQPFGDGV